MSFDFGLTAARHLQFRADANPGYGRFDFSYFLSVIVV
jgi:hypothetical protein